MREGCYVARGVRPKRTQNPKDLSPDSMAGYGGKNTSPQSILTAFSELLHDFARLGKRSGGRCWDERSCDADFLPEETRS